MTDPIDELEEFYAALKGGMPVQDFMPRYQRMIELMPKAGMTEHLRLAKGRPKRLIDEVIPVFRYVAQHGVADDLIYFAFDSSYPDCCLIQSDQRKREIEVTVGQALERLHTMRALNEKGRARGYIGLSDTEPEAAFDKAMAQPQSARTDEEVIQCVRNALEICVQNKSRYQGDILLIEITNLQTRREEKWISFADRLRPAVQRAQFSEVYMTGASQDGDICLRLK